MKKTPFVLFFVSVFAACSSSTKLLPSKEGKWQVEGNIAITLTVNGDTQTVNTKRVGIATFTDETVVFSMDSTRVYTWSASEEEVVLRDKINDSLIFDLPYTIKECRKNKMVWEMQSSNSSTTIVDYIELTR